MMTSWCEDVCRRDDVMTWRHYEKKSTKLFPTLIGKLTLMLSIGIQCWNLYSPALIETVTTTIAVWCFSYYLYLVF